MILDGKFLQVYAPMLVLVKASFLILWLYCYTLTIFQRWWLSVILLSILMRLLSALSVVGLQICCSLVCESFQTGAGSGLLISMLGKPQLVSFVCSINCCAVDVKLNGLVLDGKLLFTMLAVFSFLIGWGLLYCFYFSKGALNLYKSTIEPC